MEERRMLKASEAERVIGCKTRHLTIADREFLVSSVSARNSAPQTTWTFGQLSQKDFAAAQEAATCWAQSNRHAASPVGKGEPPSLRRHDPRRNRSGHPDATGAPLTCSYEGCPRVSENRRSKSVGSGTKER